MPNYSNGKIYKIHSSKYNLVYIGSTTQTLAQRMTTHRTEKSKCSSAKLFEFDDVKISIIEEGFENKISMLKREKYWIENSKCLNIVIPLRTHSEYCRDMNQSKLSWERYKESERTRNKKYREDNKERLFLKKLQWKKDNPHYSRDLMRYQKSHFGVIANSYFK